MYMCEYWPSNDWYLSPKMTRRSIRNNILWCHLFYIDRRTINCKMNRILWLNDSDAKICISLMFVYRHFIYRERQRSIFHLFSTLLSAQYLKSQLNCRFRFIHGHRCAVLHSAKPSIVNEANVKVINLMRLRSIGKREENQINNIKKKKEKEKVHFLPFGWTVYEREWEPARMYT